MRMLLGATWRCSYRCMCCDVQNIYQGFAMHHDTEEEDDTVGREDLLAIEDKDEEKEQLATMKQSMEQLRRILEDIKLNIKRESTV